MGLDTFGTFSTISAKADSFCDLSFAFSAGQDSCEKGSVLKGKNLLPALLCKIKYKKNDTPVEPGHRISYKIACVPNAESDQPAHSRSLITLLSPPEDALVLCYLQSALRRLNSNCADTQADLSLR